MPTGATLKTRRRPFPDFGIRLLGLALPCNRILLGTKKRGRRMPSSLVMWFSNLSEPFQYLPNGVGRKEGVAAGRDLNAAWLQPSVRNPSVERRSCDTQSLGQLLFVEEPAAVCHQIALALVHTQPVVEAAEDRVGILQLRLIPFVSPDVQARRIESGKLRPLVQLPDEHFEALQFGGPDRYFSTARHILYYLY